MFNVSHIDDYQSRLTKEEEAILLTHCNNEDIEPIIYAWYDDLEDFYSDWCGEIGYSKEDADNLLACDCENRGEFIIFPSGCIIRL